ncbi:MAG: 1-acyl-sn-glycerol-3-phosphate acyltransferase [Chloroflexi bacterium CFX2]|nr:1-acyl-sn-glycerol-3-phosphate acyltransferase [Chloroflexi bacterium CFX2]
MASMPDKPSLPPKPITEVWKPELVRLPRLTRLRLAFRKFSHGLIKLFAWACLRVTREGLENIPQRGPLLIVINHLGDADVPTLISSLPFTPDALAKIELYDLPILGELIDHYGVIWLHRGKPDKRALRAALDGLAEGRRIVIAPEGRYSLTGALEEGTHGAAFLAYKSGAPILPVAVSGTENENVYGQMKRFKRAQVHMRVGKTFRLEENESARREAMNEGTSRIMAEIANLLPEKYRGG